MIIPGFIEVTVRDYYGGYYDSEEKISTINISQIEMIQSYRCEHSNTLIHLNRCKIDVEETYDEVIRRIKAASVPQLNISSVETLNL